MKYKCLILDHDDTLVNSSQFIHYPAYIEALKQFRPNDHPLDFNTFMNQCFKPGLKELYQNHHLFSEDELNQEYLFWKSYIHSKIPEVFTRLKDVLCDFKNQEGIIVSHTHNHQMIVERDFLSGIGFLPDEIFSADNVEYMKPSIKAIDYLTQKYNLGLRDIVIMDDLMYGYEMAQSAKIDFIAPGYGITTQEIKDFFKNKATYYIEDPLELYKILDIKNTIR